MAKRPPTPAPGPSRSKADPRFIPDTSEGLETGLYLALLELIDEGLIITGDEVIFEANSAACRLLERDYRALAGRPLEQIFPSQRAFLEARERLLIQGEMRGTIDVALPNGKTRRLRFVAAARLRPGLHALIISPHGSSETLHHSAEHEDLLWPRLAAAVEQPVIVLDADMRVTTANAAALGTLDLKRQALLKHPIEKYFKLVWSSARAGSLAQLVAHDSGQTKQARVLPGPRPGWHTLLLPPLRNGGRRNRHLVDELDPLTARLSQAIVHDELEVHFQPLVDVRDESVIGGEALLRWNHPELGQLPFNRFAQSARSGDLLIELGYWVLRQALTDASTWPPSRHGYDRTVTVNLPAEQALQPELAAQLRSMLAQTGTSKGLLELDLDEELLRDNRARHLRPLAALSELGIKLAIDDYGQEASWLPALKHYPIDTLKLCPALVQGVGHNETSEALVEAVIGMGEILGLKVLARGVTTPAQRAFLSALGCHLQQGPLFGLPLTAEQFRSLLEQDGCHTGQ